jgi:hypothetical protein
MVLYYIILVFILRLHIHRVTVMLYPNKQENHCLYMIDKLFLKQLHKY